MSFSQVLTHHYYAIEDGSVIVKDTHATICGEDPASEMREEIFLPGMRMMVCPDYIIIEDHMKDQISEFDATFGYFRYKNRLQNDILKALPIINANISDYHRSILPGILMHGRVELGSGGIKRLRGMDVLFRITHGPFIQAVLKCNEIFMIGPGFEGVLTTDADIDGSKLMIEARKRAPKINTPQAYMDIKVVCL
jgi:hypothetical protein